MRHRKTGVKLGRTGSHRNAMFRNMVTSLLKHERIRTTDTKAKELRRWADHVITLAKRGDLHARRQALSIVHDKVVVHKLFERAQELFGNRAGGYTRLVKVGRRPGDAAPMTLVELVIPEEGEKKKKKKDKAAKKQPPVTPVESTPAAEQTATAPAETAPAETEAEVEETVEASAEAAPAEEAPEETPAAETAEPEAAAEEAPAADDAEQPAEDAKEEDKDA